MALFDIADVTRTVINLIKVALADTKHWTPGTEPDVFADLPNRIKKEGLGFYLFHVQESSHFKNFPAPGKDSPPVGYIPMGLNLYYQLCANSTEEDGTGPLLEQLMMGIAMKALHDNPEISDTVPFGNANRFKITLQPIKPTEAVQFWTAGESPVKLSAFYELSVVFLEPKETTSYAGKVLSYGNFIFVQGAPQITGSQNTIEYNLPGDPSLSKVKIQPAQVPIGKVVSFFGTGFNSGSMKLLVISPLWPKPAETDATWSIKLVSETQVDITMQPTATLQGTATVVTLIPGLYSARISITKQRTLPNGSVKSFIHLSNQFPFSVMPRIDNIAPGIGGLYTVTGNLFMDADIKNDDVQVYIGETSLSQTNAAPASGEFRITAVNTMVVKVPAGVHGADIPLRIMIRGTESEPRWIIIP
jgi:hypothetical protein